MTSKKLFDLVEFAIFQKQARDAREVIKIVTSIDRNLGRLNYGEIDRLIHEVSTQYKS